MSKKVVLSRAQADAIETLKGLRRTKAEVVNTEGLLGDLLLGLGSALPKLGIPVYESNAGIVLLSRNLDDIEYDVAE